MHATPRDMSRGVARVVFPVTPQIAIQSWAAYELAERRCNNSSNRKSEVAVMVDEESDWISLEDAVTYVEETQQCYREKADELVRQAVDNLKLKSRTVNSSPRWIEVAGAEVYYSDRGIRIEVWRKGLLELFPKRQNDAPQSAPHETGSAQRRFQPISDAVDSAIKELWPEGIPNLLRAKDRNNKIREWLRSRGIIRNSEDVTRTIQKVLRVQRNAHK